jgi:excisionase family DNA binding protein
MSKGLEQRMSQRLWSATKSIDPVWSCLEAANFLHLHPATIKRMAREGKLPAFRIGNRWRFRPSELDAWARSAVPSSHSLRRE